MRRHLLCLVVLVAAMPSLAQQAPDDLATLLAPLREQHKVPALGAAVIVDGKLAALGVSGKRRSDRDDVVTTSDAWHLGSCTKAMTATLLARQVEDGKLTWTTTLEQALPDLKDRLHEQTRPITLQQLLMHRAGLPAGPSPKLWNGLFRYAGTNEEARTEVCLDLLTRPPEAAPGKRFLYSNASYMLAGAIAERAGGAPWETLIQRDLFTPLGMTSAGFGPPGDEQKSDQPWGHRAGAGGKPLYADNPKSLGPAGTVHASLRDWSQFIALHLGVAPATGKPLLREGSLLALHDPHGTDYALGWAVTTRPWAPGPILTHTGSNTMWFCVAWLAPEAKFAVLVTCNQGDTGKACDAVAAALIQRYRTAKK